MITAKSLKSQKGNTLSLSKGFTLIELLVVIGILAILLAIVLIAINPARQFAQANNTKRSSDVQALLNAIQQYAADNAGALPAGLTAGMTATNIDSSLPGLCDALVTEYIAALPSDPEAVNGGANIAEADCVSYDTEYRVAISANDNRITVDALNHIQLSASISATR